MARNRSSNDEEVTEEAPEEVAPEETTPEIEPVDQGTLLQAGHMDTIKTWEESEAGQKWIEEAKSNEDETLPDETYASDDPRRTEAPADTSRPSS